MAPSRVPLFLVFGSAVLVWGCGCGGPLTSAVDGGDLAPDSGVSNATVAEGLSNDYCKCMRSYCFIVSPGDLTQKDCVAVADQVPRKGAAASTGNNIECRIHFCTVHITSYDNDDCRRAAGSSVCVGP